MLPSAAERVADRRADISHDFFVDASDGTTEGSLSDGMETIAVDHRRSVQPDRLVVNAHLCGQAADRSRDFGHRNERSNFEHL